MRNQKAPKVAPLVNIKRLKQGETASYIIISDEVFGANTHYLGQTRLCTADATCPACFAGHEPRWYGYLAVGTPAGRIELLELTAAAAEPFYRAQHGDGLLGLLVQVTKPHQRKPLHLHTTSPQRKPVQAPMETSAIWDHLVRIWGLPTRAAGESIEDHETRVLKAAETQLRWHVQQAAARTV